MARNLIRELDKASPANYHSSLGTLIEEIIVKHNTLLADQPFKANLGAPTVGVTDALVKAATGAELPNIATITYTTATDNVSPLDGTIAAPTSLLFNDGAMHLVWVLDVPRNITSVASHNSSVVAMTATFNGFDVYKNPLVETHTYTATGTSKAVAGKKAFKYLESVVIVSAADATANTLNAGYGEVLGLPYVLAEKSDVVSTFFNQIQEATLATIVVADTATVTATTGDPRGTIDLNTTLDGSAVRVWMHGGTDYVAARGIVPLSLR